MLIKRHASSNSKIKVRFFIFVGILIILFLIPATRRAIRYSVVMVATPFVYVTHGTGNWLYFASQSFRFKSSLVAENTKLMNQISDLNAQFSDYNELLQENEQLKSAMGRSDGKQFILATVLSKPPVSLYDTLLIDGGSSVGIAAGSVVYANGDAPIGVVSQVFLHSALVELYSSPSFKMDARIDPEQIDVTLFGHGGGDFLVSVPHDLSVVTDTVVVSKEINPSVLGALQKVISDPRDSSQTLIFSSPVNINQLSYVQVEKQ